MIKWLVILFIIIGLVISAPLAYQKYTVWDASNPSDDNSSLNSALLALTPKVQIITVQQSIEFNLNFPIIDVRTFKEYDGGHLPNAVSIPEPELNEKFPKMYPEKNTTVYVYGIDSNQGAIAARLLRNLGYVAYAVEKGFPAWQKAGFHIEKTNPLYF